jgi:hypothetical protein
MTLDDIKDYVNRRIAIHCKDQETAKQFLAELKTLGVTKWLNEQPIDETKDVHWKNYKKHTCYYLFDSYQNSPRQPRIFEVCIGDARNCAKASLKEYGETDEKN